jgi:hypothetical protein
MLPVLLPLPLPLPLPHCAVVLPAACLLLLQVMLADCIQALCSFKLNCWLLLSCCADL